MGSEVKEVIGFDLGHGESALARAVLEGNRSQVQDLEVNNARSQITAVGYHPQEGILIGEAALTTENVVELAVAFKCNPITEPERWVEANKKIRDFARACYQALRRMNKIAPGEQCHFYIGCPSGWSEAAREAYVEPFEEAFAEPTGGPRVSVVFESRAAFLHARDNPEAGIDLNDLAGSVLLIDLGSSTADFTHVHNLETEPVLQETGAPLGASLLDNAIFERTLQELVELGRREAVEQGFRAYPPDQAKALLECRRVKEEYFKRESNFLAKQQGVVNGLKEWKPEYEDQVLGSQKFTSRGLHVLSNDEEFKPSVDRAIMQEIIHQPLKALGDKSWIGRYRELLGEVKKKLQAAQALPGVIILTGGASRMAFTQRVCRELFPKARLVVGNEPALAVSRGLAALGRWEYHVEEFLGEVGALCDSQRLHDAVASLIPGLFDEAASPLTTGMLQVLMTTLRKGRDGVITMKDIGSVDAYLTEQAKLWMKTDEARDLLREPLKNVAARLQPLVARETNPICDRYQIERGKLHLPIELPGELVDTPTGKSMFADLLNSFANWFIDKAAYLLDAVIPIWVRKLVPNWSLDLVQRLAHTPTAAMLKRQLKQNPDHQEAITQQVLAQLRAELEDLANKARIWIQ
jgi:hypothetical protein